MVLRFLTAMPAGKVRFTIIDPSAWGKNFAAFMHLADYDEQLVAKRIWTDARQIEERLTLITEHMENVLQKYLRNEFATIHEYNAHAGEVAEPYHVLVVANFPAGFTDAAMRRLKSIATSGPRCGVYTLISVDSRSNCPPISRCRSCSNDAVHLDWANDRFRWKYPLFEKLPLELDRLPPGPAQRRPAHAPARNRACEQGRSAVRVVAPPPENIWAERHCSASWSFPSAGRGHRTAIACAWAKAPRSTCSSPARPAPASPRCCTR